jgi:hypothetical protein
VFTDQLCSNATCLKGTPTRRARWGWQMQILLLNPTLRHCHSLSNSTSMNTGFAAKSLVPQDLSLLFLISVLTYLCDCHAFSHACRPALPASAACFSYESNLRRCNRFPVQSFRRRENATSVQRPLFAPSGTALHMTWTCARSCPHRNSPLAVDIGRLFL